MSNVGAVEHRLLRHGYRQKSQNPETTESPPGGKSSSGQGKQGEGPGPAAILELSAEAQEELKKLES